MSIHAVLRGENNEIIAEQDFQSWPVCAAWIEKHYGQYDKANAHEVSAGEIRQGRNGRT